MFIKFPNEAGVALRCANKSLLMVEEYDEKLLQDAFRDTFDELKPDDFNSIDAPGAMKQRYRGFTTYLVNHEGIKRKTSEAFEQNADINRLNGNKSRFFAPIDKRLDESTVFLHLIQSLYLKILDGSPGQIGVHQIRVRVVNDFADPTPESKHRDGFHKIAVLCVQRHNVAGGNSQVYLGQDCKPHIESVLLPGQILILDDVHHLHAVSPIVPIDKNLEAYRDVFVFTGKPDAI
jgi:hypothetical protein